VARELCPNPGATRDIYAERCACGARLPATGQALANAYDHIELPPIKPVTTRINLHRADCRGCGKTVTAAPPADMPPGSPFGPGIVALVAYLHGCQMVSCARLAEMLDGLFGLKISECAIANMLQRAPPPRTGAGAAARIEADRCRGPQASRRCLSRLPRQAPRVPQAPRR
jgi:transposase